MANEIKQLNAAKQESERRRKQAEAQLQEVTIKLSETDRSKEDMAEKITKMSVSDNRGRTTRSLNKITDVS